MAWRPLGAAPLAEPDAGVRRTWRDRHDPCRRAPTDNGCSRITSPGLRSETAGCTSPRSRRGRARLDPRSLITNTVHLVRNTVAACATPLLRGPPTPCTACTPTPARPTSRPTRWRPAFAARGGLAAPQAHGHRLPEGPISSRPEAATGCWSVEAFDETALAGATGGHAHTIIGGPRPCRPSALCVHRWTRRPGFPAGRPRRTTRPNERRVSHLPRPGCASRSTRSRGW